MTNDQKTDALQRAIDYRGAVEVAPRRYAFKAGTQERWYTTDADGLTWQSGQTYESGKDESWWGRFALMPAWWTPERRFAVYHPVKGSVDCTRETASLAWIAAHALWNAGDWSQYEHPSRVVTADLTTGEEVPA